jgi:hypothetical protein
LFRAASRDPEKWRLTKEGQIEYVLASKTRKMRKEYLSGFVTLVPFCGKIAFYFFHIRG